MIRTISAPGAFLLLTVSCLLSVAQGRELLGTMIFDNIKAVSHTQGSNDRIAELEAKYESLMQAFANQQDIINALQSADAWQNATIELNRASISTLANEVATNTASVKTLNTDVSKLQSNVTSINTDIVNITNEVTADEADIQTNSAAIAANAGAIASNSQAIASLDSELQQLNTTVIPDIAANITRINAQILDIDSEITVLTQNITEINSTVININKTVVNDEADLSSLEDRVQTLEQEEVANGKAIAHNDGLIATNTADIAVLQQNFTALNATDLEERVQTLEVEERVNSMAIAFGDQEIQWNVGNITLLNETIQNGTIPSGLTEKVDANTASISSLTSTVDSDASRITHLEGMELLEDHYYVPDGTNYPAGTSTIGSFTVSAGNVLDFKAAYLCQFPFRTEIRLYNGGENVTIAYCTENDGANQVIIYREHVSSDTTFTFYYEAAQSGSFYSPYDFWGYKIYAGSSYNFIEG